MMERHVHSEGMKSALHSLSSRWEPAATIQRAETSQHIDPLAFRLPCSIFIRPKRDTLEDVLQALEMSMVKIGWNFASARQRVSNVSRCGGGVVVHSGIPKCCP